MSELIRQSLGRDLWQNCVDLLAQELPEQQFNTWIKPLVADVASDLSKVTVQVGNRFKLDWVRAQYAARIVALLEKISGQSIALELALAPRENPAKSTFALQNFTVMGAAEPAGLSVTDDPIIVPFKSRLNTALTFDTLIEGTANRMGRHDGR